MALTYQQILDYIRANPNQSYLQNGEREVTSPFYHMPGQAGTFALQGGSAGNPLIKWMGDRNGQTWNDNITYNPDGTTLAGRDYGVMNGFLDNNIDTIGWLGMAAMGGAALSQAGAFGAGAGAGTGTSTGGGGLLTSGASGTAGTVAGGAGGGTVAGGTVAGGAVGGGTAGGAVAGGTVAGGTAAGGAASSAIPQMVITGSNAAAGAGTGLTAGQVAAGAAAGTGVANMANSGSFSDARYDSQNNVSQDWTGSNSASTSLSDIWNGVPQGVKDFLTSKFGAAAAGALLGAVNGSSKVGDQTITSKTEIDPRMAGLLYGTDGKGGLLNDIVAAGKKPQNAGMQQFGNGMDDYLKNWGTDNFMRSQQAAQRLQDSNIAAPTMTAAKADKTADVSGAKVEGIKDMASATVANTPEMQAALARAAQIQAPSQNGLNLSSAYNQMVYGDPAENPYLTGAIQKGINQSSNAFGNMMYDATRNLNENILPGIRSGAIVNGSMGSSRQGIAEGNALKDYNTQMGRAMSQFGQNNTDAALAAQSGVFDAGQNRALSAMSGLGALQYGVANQNAGFDQQTNLANAGYQNNAAQTNYQGNLQTNLTQAGFDQQANQTNYQGALQRALANAGYQQQANLANQSASLQTNLANAGFAQGANQANLGSQLTTNQLNSSNQLNGINASSGLLNQAYGYGTNQDSYDINKVAKTAGAISPFTGLNSTGTTNTPLYENKTANALGGGLLGVQMLNSMNKP